MKAVILAGGFAKRLWPLTKDTPKPLLEVAGKTIIEHILAKVELIDDVDEIFISTNSKFEEQFKRFVNNYNSTKKIKLVIEPALKEGEKLGSIGGLKYLIDKENITDDLMVVGGDNLFEFDLSDIFDFYTGKNSAVIAVHDVRDRTLAQKYGIVVINGKSRIINFEEKPSKPRSTLASTAIYLYPSRVLKLVREYLEQGNSPDKAGEFIAWLHKRENVYAFVFKEKWFDIGSFEVLDQAKQAKLKDPIKSLLECRYDLRWASCLADYGDYLQQYHPDIESDPLSKGKFEEFVEHTDTSGYYSNVKCACNIAKALVKLKCNGKSAVVVGKDIRPGTDFIARNFINTLLQHQDVIYVGEGTTGYVAFCANYLAKKHDVAFSVQLSASHTVWYNIGIEPQYGNDNIHVPGTAFNADDLEKVRQDTVANNNMHNENTRGEFKNLSSEMCFYYVDTVVELFKKIVGDYEDVRQSKLVMLIDTGNSIAKKYVEMIFERLGLRYKIINKKYSYIPNRAHDPNCKEVHELMKKEIVEKKGAVIGVAYDSDADRSPFFDEKGEVLQGDWIAALIVKQLQKSGLSYVFGFETNNHIGVPILVDKGKHVVGTVDAGRYMEDISPGFSRVSIGKPFLFEKISSVLKGKEYGNIIPHTDGPFVSALVYALVARIFDKDKGIKQSILDAIPELNNYNVLRENFDVAEFIGDSKGFEETKVAVLDKALERFKENGYEVEKFDKITGIIKNDDFYALIRCSGHNNFEFRLSFDSKKDVNDEMKRVKDVLIECAKDV